MNGEMNGEVEEKMDTSTPLSPSHSKVKNDTEEVMEQPDNNCEDSINSTADESEDSRSPEESNVASSVNNENSNESSQPASSVAEPNTQDTTDTIKVTENHCSNSTESDSNDSSKPKENESITNSNHEKQNSVNDADSVRKNIRTRLMENDSDEIDSEEDSSDEGSISEGSEGRPEDTVSIKSDSDNDTKNKGHKNETTQNGDNTSQSSEIHEIDSNDEEDCIVTDEVKGDHNDADDKDCKIIENNKTNEKVENGDDESDIEEISDQDPFNSKPSNSKKPEPLDPDKVIELATNQLKYLSTITKKDPLSMDNNNASSKSSPKNTLATMSPASAHTLYQSIAARGTTVTPVSVKSTPIQSQAQNVLPILPSLTDDMFVVEAPSFIVPYVYEKPSVKPFREFVDVLGRELEEMKLKEELERKAKEEDEIQKEEADKMETDKDEQDKQKDEKDPLAEEDKEEKDRSEDKIADKSDTLEDEESVKKDEEEKKETKKGRKRRKEDDDASWDGESSAESDDLSDEDKTEVIKEKDDSLDGIKDPIATDPSADIKTVGVKTDSYFDNTLGKFFITIGLNLVQEFVQADLLKQQRRKLHKENRAGASTKGTESAISQLMKNIEFSKENNAPYTFKQQKCEYCSFKSESVLVMAHHMETPHMKNNVYKCNFCPYEIRSPHDILYHMEAEHNIRGRLERAPAYHQCANCPFEDNGKGKLARHLIPCAKKFKPEINLAPPVEWEPPAKIPKISRARNNMMSTYQAAFNRSAMNTPGMNRPMLNPAAALAAASGFRGRRMPTPPIRPPALTGAPMVRGGLMVRHNSPVGGNYPGPPPALKSSSKMLHQPSISITPLPRAPQPTAAAQAKGSFVICEICDGYIKDLEQLRNHMQWIHKVKIHPKMIYNRPPLNCQKCQFRFFTDQGLERHLLGSHGLVTSSMQEAANKGKDAGRCPVCGRVYQWKLLNHVARDHNLTLKPAHLSYKCTVCTATFGMYKQFENHVYSAHSVVAKRVTDKGKPAPAPVSKTPAAPTGSDNSLLKPLKINDEITIIPQMNKPAPNANSKPKKD